MTIEMPIPGSFRDPAGRVYIKDDEIYRCVFELGKNDFEAAREAGIHDALIKAGLLLPHKMVDGEALKGHGPTTPVYRLHHPRLPMISYPWEWPFSMLKDAALLHLDVMEKLIPLGFWLRDASAFNAQYHNGGLCLIDTLSLGRRIPEGPWLAYGQFCSHFLAPLAVAAYRDIRLLSLWREYNEGFPLDLASKMLPLRMRLRPGIFMHLWLHAHMQERSVRKGNLRPTKPYKLPKVTDRGLIGLLGSLRRTIEGISWAAYSKIWADYGEIRTYDEEDASLKAEYVERTVNDLRPRMVWDLGANTGEYSLIAASSGAFVVGIDGDPACTESLYQRVASDRGSKRVLPLTMNLANPSPGLGWDGRERLSLKDRGPADLLMSLALIHHLVFRACVPLSNIAEWFAGLARYLLVEFVPPTDPMVKRLMMNRIELSHPYDLDVFKSSFGKFFHFMDQRALRNGRVLVLCRARAEAALLTTSHNTRVASIPVQGREN
jgi:hypothetical protein